MNVGRYSAHVVVHRRQHRDGFPGHVYPCKNFCGLRDTRKPLGKDLGAQMLKVQVNMIRLGTEASSGTDFHSHRPADHVSGCKVASVGGITFHETLTRGIGQEPPFATSTLRDQAAGTIDPGRMKLHELHILERQPGAKNHCITIAGAGMRRSR